MSRFDNTRTKKEQLVEALVAGDIVRACQLARNFNRELTAEQRRVAARAAEFHVSTLYREMGYDEEKVKHEAELMLRVVFLNDIIKYEEDTR